MYPANIFSARKFPEIKFTTMKLVVLCTGNSWTIGVYFRNFMAEYILAVKLSAFSIYLSHKLYTLETLWKDSKYNVAIFHFVIRTASYILTFRSRLIEHIKFNDNTTLT